MRRKQLNSSGITAIEFLVGFLIFSVILTVSVTNIRTLRAENRDTSSKKDLNTLAFRLESFYQKNNFYPEVLSKEVLSEANDEIFTDSRGGVIGKGSNLYSYTPGGCVESKCKQFELTANLERETPFTKESLNN